MTYYDIGIKWTGRFKREPLIQGAVDRTALLALAAIVAALPPLLKLPAVSGNTGAACAGLVIAIISLRTVYLSGALQPPDGRRELAWLAAACMLYPLGAVARLDPHRLSELLIETLNRISELSGIGVSLPLTVVLIINLGGVAVVSIRVRSAAQMENRNCELERMNRALAIAFREEAEVLAEMAMLDERSRIANEIHDVVGHTLTAAIVQLEATKMIAQQNNCIPWDRLELLNVLVRRGLEDVRRTVRLICSDEAETMTLETTLRELIQSAEQTMDIAIEADISLSSRPEPGELAKQVLYHALQEGLTNGIRHGKCARARFSLRPSGRLLQFRLVSDGEPYGSSVPGFGLSSMMDRVKLLGGRVDVRSSVDAAGNPVGCELSIDLPLAG
jgi:signal transduction histidine kinase